MTEIPNEPLGATPQWRAAVLAANLTCQCHARECGRAHGAGGGKCAERMREMFGIRLHVVIDAERGQIVVCGDCFDGRRTIANRAAKKAAADRLEACALFAADGPKETP